MDSKDFLMINPFTCPICNSVECVPPSGNKESKILLIGDFPEKDEVQKGKLLVGRTGDILRSELGRLGVDVRRLRACNVWQHHPNNNEDCYNLGLQIAIKEAKNKQVILLLGAGAVKIFTGENVRDVCGLNLKSTYLSAPIIISCVSPGIAFHSSIGELRLALTKFAKATEEILC